MRRRHGNIVSFLIFIQAVLSFSSSLKASRKVLSERWLNIGGSAVQDLTTNPQFPKHPTKIKYLINFKEIVYGQNYGGRYRTYLLSQEPGNYTFYTFCDDSCQLFISSGINPSDKRMIINQYKNVAHPKNNCCSNAALEKYQISAPQYLEKNKVYYMEALLKQGQGFDRMYVGMRKPSGDMKLPIGDIDLTKNVTKEYIPEDYCKTGDPNYPDYVDCKKLPDSQKINLVVSLLKDLQSRIDNAENPTTDFLLVIMETAGKKTSKLLESLNDSFVDQNVNESNRAFEIAREVEILGERIASRINNASTVIAVNYSSIEMKATYAEKMFCFDSPSSPTSECGSQNSIKITLGNSTPKMAHFFSAFYKQLDEAIQRNISDVYSGNTSSAQIPYYLNSRIISGSVIHPANESFNGHVTIRLEHKQFKSLEKMTMVCAFWRYSDSSGSNSSGHWSTEGCRKDEQLSNDEATVCHCNHLTHFAVLMRVSDDRKVVLPGKPHIQALEIITYVGCSLSLLGEILTIVTITCLKLTRSETSVIHLNLVAALAVAQIIFLTGIEATQNKAACKIVAVLLHYFNLVSFTWMLVEGIWLYFMIVRVFESGHSRIKKYCAGAWGIPFVFVVITLSASFDGYGTDTSCWLSVQKGTIWSFVVPVLLIAVANSIILGMVVKEILRLNHPTTTDNTKYQSARSGVQSAVVLLPLLGITWLFGILTFNSDTLAFQYLFAIFNSLQGFFIFLFHCLLNSEVRRVFNRKKKIWSESHDMLQTHSLSPQNYNDLSKDTLSTRNGSLRPGSGGSAVSNLSQRL